MSRKGKRIRDIHVRAAEGSIAAGGNIRAKTIIITMRCRCPYAMRCSCAAAGWKEVREQSTTKPTAGS